jgi:hypothetical protein
VAAHPDRLGGLRFTLIPTRAFDALAFAAGAAVCGTIANAVLIDGRSLTSFRFVVLAQVALVIGLFAGPLLLWMPRLIRLQEAGTHTYGALALGLGHAFEERWIGDGAPAVDAGALQAADFSATTDLYSIVANVRDINPYVLDLQVVALLVASTLVPYIPLLLAVTPVEELLTFVVKAFA